MESTGLPAAPAGQKTPKGCRGRPGLTGPPGRRRRGTTAGAPRSRIEASRRLCIRSGERPDDFFLLGGVRRVAEGLAVHLLRLRLPLTAAKYPESLIHERFDQGVPARSQAALRQRIDYPDGRLGAG